MTTEHKPHNVLDEMNFKVSVGKAEIIEERLRVIIQPKPRWLPDSIWRRVLGRLLYLEESSS